MIFVLIFDDVGKYRNGVVYEEEKASMLSEPPSNASLVDHVKQESSVNNYVYGNEEFHGTPTSTWSQIVSVPSSSSKSCATSFTSSSMLDFSNTKTDVRSPPSDLSSDQVYIFNKDHDNFMVNQS